MYTKMYTLLVCHSLKLAAYTARNYKDGGHAVGVFNSTVIHSCCCLESLARGTGVAGAPFPGLDTPANIDQELDARCCIATLRQACM